MAPWIRDYHVNMEDLYSELNLEKVENKPTGPMGQVIRDYTKMFNFKFRHKSQSIRIILKGEPGMGKSTFSKKVAWDWASNEFTLFEIVFVVFLKFVKKELTIEQVILDQYPVLEGLSISEQKLRSLLNKFGGKMLLILDGLDEHAFGENKDVSQVIRRQKYAQCNVFLTSRPHSTQAIEKYFQTVVLVKGFTYEEAKKFASRIVQDEAKVKQILEFNPTRRIGANALHTCPILLSFICLLVREGELDLTDKTVQTGEIYTRMVRCLYKKFTIRKEIEFDSEKLQNVLFRVGKLASETLLSWKPLMRKSDVINLVGKEAFDYGLLIGHEDGYLLRQDETADIYVTFPHRSLQEFLGAFYFVLSISYGVPIEKLMDRRKVDPIYITNPLFLQFCLWLIFNSQKYFSVENTDKVCSTLQEGAVNCIRKNLRSTAMNLDYILHHCPALEVDLACLRNDIVAMNFFEPIIQPFHSAVSIEIEFSKTLQWILKTIPSVVQSIEYVKIAFFKEELFSYLESVHFGNLRVRSAFVRSPYRCVSLFLSTEDHSRYKHLVLYRGGPSYYDITRQKIKYLKLERNYLALSSDTEMICVLDKRVEEKTFCDLNEMAVKSMLPNLRELIFSRCTGLEKRIGKIFASCLPSLTHLCLYGCKLADSDCEALSSAIASKRLPRMHTIILPVHKMVSFDSPVTKLVKQAFLNAQNVFLDVSRSNLQILFNDHEDWISNCRLDNLGFSNSIKGLDVAFLSALKIIGLSLVGIQPQISGYPDLDQRLFHILINADTRRLTYLNLSRNKIPNRLSELLELPLQSLKTLILRGCSLQTSDIDQLRKAETTCRIPSLTHLDLSKNKRIFWLDMFSESCRWERLEVLNVLSTQSTPGRYSESDFDKMLFQNCLSKIIELSISIKKLYDLPAKRPHLKVLRVNGHHQSLTRSLANLVSKGLFPSLKTICLPRWSRKHNFFGTIPGVSCHNMFEPPSEFCAYVCAVCHELQEREARATAAALQKL